MLLIVLYCRIILRTFSWKLRRAAECLSGHVGKWYNLAVFSGVIQNPHGAEVLRQAGCENFLTMAFSSPSGIKRAPGDLNCPPFVGQYTWTVYNYILYNYSNHHTSGEHGIERKTPHATRHTPHIRVPCGKRGIATGNAAKNTRTRRLFHHRKHIYAHRRTDTCGRCY